MSVDSSSAVSMLKKAGLVIGKIVAYGIAWFILAVILTGILESGVGLSENAAAGSGLLVSTLVVGLFWMWWRGWLGDTQEDTVVEDSSSEEVLSGKAVEDRKSDSHLEESGDWYWSKKGSAERNGPVSRERLEELAEEGELQPEDLVWHKSFDDWKEAGSVEEIEELFASPPPLPDDSSDEKGEEPPTLSQSESDDDHKATKSEALSCIHDYDENDVCPKCGWARQELKEMRGNIEREETAIAYCYLAHAIALGDGELSDAERKEIEERTSHYLRSAVYLNDVLQAARNELELNRNGEFDPSRSKERIKKSVEKLNWFIESSDIEGTGSFAWMRRQKVVEDLCECLEYVNGGRKWTMKTIEDDLDSGWGGFEGKLGDDYVDVEVDVKTNNKNVNEGLGSREKVPQEEQESKQYTGDEEYVASDKVGAEGKIKDSNKNSKKERKVVESTNSTEKSSRSFVKRYPYWTTILTSVSLLVVISVFEDPSKESRAASACAEKAKEEYEDPTLFGRMRPDLGGIADESSDYPGQVLKLGEDEYLVSGFVATEHIDPEGLTGDAYSGNAFDCKVEITKNGANIVSFQD